MTFLDIPFPHYDSLLMAFDGFPIDAAMMGPPLADLVRPISTADEKQQGCQ